MTTLHALSWYGLLGLLACGPGKPEPADSAFADSGEEEGGGSWYPDDDQDGYGDAFAEAEIAVVPPIGTVGNAEDCDDEDPDIYPGGMELCNRKDDDCDGEIDEDPETAGAFYPDEDGDEHGDASAEPVRACEEYDGYTSRNDDCDDNDPAVHPGADEDCANGIDDDCDGDVDEDDSGHLVYPDLDDDGWGDDEGAIASCLAPEYGYIRVGGDCDDLDGTTYPGAVEYCDDADNDCDGYIDVDGESQWYLDEDGDGYGDAVFTVDGCDAPEGGVALGGDCDEIDPSISPAAVEVCENDIDEDCDTVDSSCEFWGPHGLGEADARAYCGDEAQTGIAVASAGDTDGDGTSDMWVGARAGGADRAGQVYLVDGVASETGELPDLASATFTGRSAEVYAGESIANAGDLDGDGYPEVWIGTPYDRNEDGAAAGSASLIFGPFEGEESLSAADTRWMGEERSDAASVVASGADLDSDGLLDAAIGAYWRSSTERLSGSVYIVLGEPPSGDASLSEANVELYGVTESGALGARVSIVGDTNADGQQDLAMNDNRFGDAEKDAGAVFLLTDLPSDGEYLVSDVAQVIPGDSEGMGLGADICPVGDVNGDGYEDLAVGASEDSEGAEYAGAVFLVEGPASALTTIVDAAAKWTGTEVRQYASKVAGGEDMDGDGHLDLAIGGWYGYTTYPGATYIIRGPFEEGTHSLADADATFMGESISDEAGRALAMLSDANGDGYADLLIGAPGVEDGCGAAYLVLGAAY